MPKIQYKTVRLSNGTEDYLSTLEVGVKDASNMLGMSMSTLKNSNIPCEVTEGGHRRYNLMNIINIVNKLIGK